MPDHDPQDAPVAKAKPATKNPPEPPPSPPDPREKVPVTELPRLTGHVLELKFPAKRTIPDAAHEAASSLHGWAEHAHHVGKPLELTRRDYEAALEAAAKPRKGERRLRPHQPALSPHCPHRFGEANEETR